jgi:5-formyltetrahydrofolate cyclo-ligase
MNHWQEWRKQQRITLLAQRKSMSAADREEKSKTITTFLKQGFPMLQHGHTGFYWPYQGECDLVPVMQFFHEQGAILALPEITERSKPLRFRQWWPGAPMKPGLFNIPTPDNTNIVEIDTVIVPMVGFDQQGYRLGYGGGYYDRTLALSHSHPMTIGIAFEIGHMDSIHPQSHDIPMDFIVTEREIYQTDNGKLLRIGQAG